VRLFAGPEEGSALHRLKPEETTAPADGPLPVGETLPPARHDPHWRASVFRAPDRFSGAPAAPPDGWHFVYTWCWHWRHLRDTASLASALHQPLPDRKKLAEDGRYALFLVQYRSIRRYLYPAAYSKRWFLPSRSDDVPQQYSGTPQRHESLPARSSAIRGQPFEWRCGVLP